MPLYEYRCRKCGTRFEALISIFGREKEERKLTCPKCGTPDPKREVSSFATGQSGSSYRSCSPRG